MLHHRLTIGSVLLLIIASSVFTRNLAVVHKSFAPQNLRIHSPAQLCKLLSRVKKPDSVYVKFKEHGLSIRLLMMGDLPRASGDSRIVRFLTAP